nr:MAG TPA: hypothetical protein [Bacteriophage sp.]DAJ11501.1 MAG TPA: hypothetical protein [Bacteriophage sp.]
MRFLLSFVYYGHITNEVLFDFIPSYIALGFL